MTARNAGSPWWYRYRSFVIFVIYMAGFSIGPRAWDRSTPFHYTHALLWTGTALAFLGFAVRLWGSSYLHANVVWNRNALDDRLIVAGPFRYIRNPLYFGNNLQAVGIGLLASPFGFAFIVLASALFTSLLAAHEARLMQSRYGAVYERFRAAVPSMLPRLTPATVEGSVSATPSIASGMRSELLTLGFAVGMLGIAVYGVRAFPLFGAFWIGGWILQNLLRAISEPKVREG